MNEGTTSPHDQSAASAPYGIAPPGYRLPAATRLGAVRLQVADLDRSLAWYGRVLGLEPFDRTTGEPWPEDGGPIRTGSHGSARVARLGVPGSRELLVELHEHPGAAA